MENIKVFFRIMKCEKCNKYTSHEINIIRKMFNPETFTATKKCTNRLEHPDATIIGFVYVHDDHLP